MLSSSKSARAAGSDFHDEKRSNATHESRTALDARLYKKSYGKEAKLAYLVHTAVENCNGPIAAAMVTPADGTAERYAAILTVADLTEEQRRCIRWAPTRLATRRIS